MSYCEGESQLDYVLGLAKNSRLIEAIGGEMAEAQQIFQSTQKSARILRTFAIEPARAGPENDV